MTKSTHSDVDRADAITAAMLAQLNEERPQVRVMVLGQLAAAMLSTAKKGNEDAAFERFCEMVRAYLARP